MIHDRHGFELAINTLVVMILGIVLIGGGIFLLSKILSSTEDLSDISDTEQRYLNEQYAAGQLVSVYPKYEKVSAGKSVHYAIGIKNIMEDKKFSINITHEDVTKNNLFTIRNLDELTVEKNTKKAAKVLITPKSTAPLGENVFIVTITYLEGPNTIEYEKRFFTVIVQ